MIKIKNMEQSLRPREKALKYGVNALSNEELLAILIRTGTKQLSCLDIAANLLKTRKLSQLGNLKYNQLVNEPGISTVKAIELLCVFEIGKRMSEAVVYDNKIVANEPEPIVNYMRSHYGNLTREVFVVFYLNNACTILDIVEISRGTIDTVGAYPREIFKHALTINSAAIIVSHNHPSGLCNPSDEDIYLTTRLQHCAEIMEVTLLDHIIVSSSQYYSFNANHAL